jgi:hypothetical protein
MTSPSPTAASGTAPSRTVPSPSVPASRSRSLDPEIRRIAVWLVRFIGALLLVWLAVWWVLPVHVFSGPVIWVFDDADQHGLHLGDLPAVLWIVAAFWLAWPTRRGRQAHHGVLDALRVATVGGLGALSLYWIVPGHSWSGPTLFNLGHRHGMHLLDPVVLLFLGPAVLLGWRWRQPVAAGFLVVFALWWAAGTHASFSGPVIVRWHGRVLHRSDPIALVFLAAATVIGLPWLRARWDRFQRERAENRTRAAAGSVPE